MLESFFQLRKQLNKLEFHKLTDRLTDTYPSLALYTSVQSCMDLWGQYECQDIQYGHQDYWNVHQDAQDKCKVCLWILRIAIRTVWM